MLALGAGVSGLGFRHMRRVGLMLAAVLATLVAASVVALPNQAAPAEAAGNDVIAIVLEGTGNGHGRGMSQWGAYGWAVDHGWSWDQILDWYYGGTAMGDADVNSRMTVRLQGMDGVGAVGVVSYAGGVTLERGDVRLAAGGQESERAVLRRVRQRRDHLCGG